MLTTTTLAARTVTATAPAAATIRDGGAPERQEHTMSRIGFGMRRAAAWLWTADRPLAAGTGIMLGALLASAVGIVVDQRTITGVPAWLKPAKFAASTAIYTATLAWVFTYLGDWPRT